MHEWKVLGYDIPICRERDKKKTLKDTPLFVNEFNLKWNIFVALCKLNAKRGGGGYLS